MRIRSVREVWAEGESPKRSSRERLRAPAARCLWLGLARYRPAAAGIALKPNPWREDVRPKLDGKKSEVGSTTPVDAEEKKEEPAAAKVSSLAYGAGEGMVAV